MHFFTAIYFTYLYNFDEFRITKRTKSILYILLVLRKYSTFPEILFFLIVLKSTMHFSVSTNQIKLTFTNHFESQILIEYWVYLNFNL